MHHRARERKEYADGTVVNSCFEMSNFFEYRQTPYRWMLWLTLPWISLIWGAAYSCWGALLAAPERQSVKPSRFSMRAIVKRPLLANSICLILPLIQSISIIIPGAIANARCDAALERYLTWQQVHADDQSLSQEALVEAVQIYNIMLSGGYAAATTFSIWTLWAGLFFLAFSKITAGLFFDILRHARRLNSTFTKHGTISAGNSGSWKARIPRAFKSGVGRASSINRTKSATLLGHNNSTSDEKNASSLTSTGEEGIGNPAALVNMSAASPRGAPTRAWSTDSAHHPRLATTDEEEVAMSAEGRRAREIEIGLEEMMQIGADTMHVFSRQEVAEDLPNTSFFPPVKPSKVIGTPAQLANTSTRAHHARLFRRLVINFGFQFSGICLAILAYMSIALFLAIRFYASFENNTIGYCIGSAVLVAMWAAVLFGSITLFAIAARTYETAVPPGGVSQPGSRIETVPNAGVWSEMPPANSVMGSTRAGKKPSLKFTRATKMATALAQHDVTVAGQDETQLGPGADSQIHSIRGVTGVAAMRAALEEEEEEADFQRLAALRSPASVTFEQWPSSAAAEQQQQHKLLTPSDFQMRRAPRVGAAVGFSTPPSGNSPPDNELSPLQRTLDQPMSPASRRHGHSNSLKLNSSPPRRSTSNSNNGGANLGRSDGGASGATEMSILTNSSSRLQQQQQKRTPIPRIAYSHDESPSARHSVDYVQAEAAQGDDSDLE